MNRLRAIAIATITTLIFASLAIGITANTRGGNAPIDAVVTSPQAPAPSDAASPSGDISNVSSQPVSFDDREGDYQGHEGHFAGGHEDGEEEDD
jgi:hypothetical protein